MESAALFERRMYVSRRPHCLLTLRDCSIYSLPVVRKWLTSVALSLVMLTSVVGVGAHQQEGSCPMSNVPDCCKKAQSHGPEASMARLCCNLNCSEPGSSGNSSSSFSTQRLSSAPAVLNASQPSFRIVFPQQPQQLHLHDSNPKYITHLALLI